MDVAEASAVCDDVIDAVASAVVADRQVLETVLTGVLSRGHVLLEDVPGTGKTLTAQSFATALGLSFKRIQFTPDLLPGDITGSHIYREDEGTFEFTEGPVFSNVVLADEINRAPPKTQAALLEAMSESQVSADGTTYQLPEPFFVIATQNPVEQEGTFALPEAQRDRFILKTELGYPDEAGAREIIDRRADRTSRTPDPETVIDGERVTELQAVPETVRVDGKLRDYVIELGRATREDDRVDVGVSPRGIQRLFEASRSRAVIEGRDYVAPDDVRAVVHEAFEHRLVLTSEATVRGVTNEEIVADVLDGIEVPAVATAND
ncbi:MoxR family ATPase [Natronomonas gomsonensis]|jgi:MoxR-like ATPase|uniref:AAA family ATPase n=1 Tax=Natronomonas gomsonensis TaxID=1046043 RepID=UPI0020CA459E|nr:MoxR family ATPase [Natronomonas gomsonensis]MCY4731724.1 MoxR family ATPase [Natronomonas gomsonensis]